MEEQFLYPKSTKVSVWCGIMLQKIIEPKINHGSNLSRRVNKICGTTAGRASAISYFPAGRCTTTLRP